MLELEKLVERALKHVDYCEMRYESSENTTIEIKNKELKKAISGSESGVALRVLYKGAWGFAATNDLSNRSLEDALENAIKLAKASSRKIKTKVKLAEYEASKASIKLQVKEPPSERAIEDKYKSMQELSKYLLTNSRLHASTITYKDSTLDYKFYNSDGSNLETQITRIMVQANLVAKKESKVLGSRHRIGGTGGLELLKTHNPFSKFLEAAKILIKQLDAEKAPGGRFKVVVDNELVGVFIHEALGHACEADSVLAGRSILENKLGKLIASKLVTVYDNPLIENGFGTFPYDDEGVKAENKLLIEKGILRNFILSRETAKKLNLEPNGGARAGTYAVRPLVRMSNTVLAKGDYSFEELLEDLKFGVYVKGTRGGQVNTAKGTFQFAAQEAWLVEKGELTKPLRDVSLSGNTLETLKNIDAIGEDFKLGEPGFCGKGYGQIVPVGLGGPTVRVKEAILGGK
jgi:TldD protein